MRIHCILLRGTAAKVRTGFWRDEIEVQGCKDIRCRIIPDLAHIKRMRNGKPSIKIRPATKNDLTAINDIYNYYVDASTCTYQTEPESLPDRNAWFEEHGSAYPIFVAEENGNVVGWASLSKFKKREAYKPTVESSIYIRNDRLYKGIGAELLSELIKSAREIGYHSLIAVISSDQGPSIKLHEKNGFAKVAHLKEVGRKFGKWLDVVYYQLLLS